MSRLFLSSTAGDLAEFRDVAIHVCQRLGIDVIAMEDFGPDPRAAAAVCQSKIEQADLFLGLYAHRYGYVPDGLGGASITELEYEWARQRKRPPPVLLFLVDEDLPWPPKHIDDGDAKKRLQKFKAKLRGGHTVSTLTTLERFKEELFVYLPKFRDRARPGVAPVHGLPTPPEPYVAHQYTLLQTNQVIGRENELQTLDRWVGDPASELAAARLLCVVAIGGMGKSALTWKWFHQHAPRAMPSLAGRFWWSFYESDAGFDRFVTTALAYCSGASLETVAALPAVDREVQLLAILDRHSFLLVLDGLERVLIAYSNLDFAHLADEELDARTANAVAGARGLPQEAGSSFIGQHRLRKTIDPRVGNFLRKLAYVQAARILVSTRLYPSELQTVTGQEIPGTAAWFLRGMTPEDALALWRAMGVSGTDPELVKLFAAIDHYPLLIRALAGEVARYRRAPGDLDQWRRAHTDFDPFSLPLVQVKSHILAHALGDLHSDARELLHTVAAFRAPVPYDTLAALFLKRRRWAAEKLDAVLTELEDRGLVGWDRRANQYDLHPIVRGVVWQGLGEIRQREVYGTLQQHFAAVPKKGAGANTVAQALPMIELFTALVGLRRYDDAANLYFDRLFRGNFSFVDVGMQQLNIALLESLFPNGRQRPPKNTVFIAGVFAQLGIGYETMGRLMEARSCFVRQLAAESPPSTAHAHIAKVAILEGRLREAIEQGNAALDSDHRRLREYYVVRLAEYQATLGDVQTAMDLLQANRKFISQDEYLAQIHFWQGEYERAAMLAGRALKSKDPETRLAMAILLAEVAMNLARTSDAGPMLLDVLRQARAKSVVRWELQALRVLADLHRRLGDFAASRTCLDDLAEPAARGPYRLIQADAANVLAELERDCGNKDAAITAAQDAYRLAWCDGPPYAYHWGLDHAKRLLRDLGAPFPDTG